METLYLRGEVHAQRRLPWEIKDLNLAAFRPYRLCDSWKERIEGVPCEVDRILALLLADQDAAVRGSGDIAPVDLTVGTAWGVLKQRHWPAEVRRIIECDRVSSCGDAAVFACGRPFKGKANVPPIAEEFALRGNGGFYLAVETETHRRTSSGTNAGYCASSFLA